MSVCSAHQSPVQGCSACEATFDLSFKCDGERLRKFVEKFEAKFEAFEPEVRASGIPAPVVFDGQLETVDLWTLDAASLLAWLRRDPKFPENVVFMLLGWSATDYLKVADPEKYELLTKGP